MHAFHDSYIKKNNVAEPEPELTDKQVKKLIKQGMEEE